MASRILLYGVTGAGKSTAAVRVGAATGLPVTLVDELTWEPGWVPVAEAEQRARIAAIVAGDTWVLDTAYSAWLDDVLPRADLVVCLDYPRWVSFQRLVRRSVVRTVRRTPVCNGNVESLGSLVARDSIIRWHFGSFARKRARMRAWAADDDRVMLFDRPRELDAWIADLTAPGGKMFQ